MHQQYHTTNNENNHVHDPQIQEKTSIPLAPTTTHHCNFYSSEGYYASTREGISKADAGLWYRIVAVTNMAKIYLDLEDGPKEDSDFYLAAHINNDDRMRDTYITYIRICPM